MATADSTRRAGPILTAWVALLILIHAADWLVGSRSPALVRAIEQGEARVEAQTAGADLSADAVRKLIQLQRDTRPFWTTLTLLGDFGAAPLALIGRPLAVATLFAAWAALAGRPNGFGPALVESAALQGFWLIGPALSLGLTLAGVPGGPDTALSLFLPPGPHPAWTWAVLHNADIAGLCGWLALAEAGRRRRQVSLGLALATLLPLALAEVAFRAVAAAVIEAGMRLTIIPG